MSYLFLSCTESESIKTLYGLPINQPTSLVINFRLMIYFKVAEKEFEGIGTLNVLDK